MEYLKKLQETIAKWNEDPIEDEWLFQKFRDEVVGQMPPDKAFPFINDTISVLEKQTDESTAIEVLETVISLARQSDTTEVPKRLYETKEAISEQFKKYGDYANRKLNELFKYYRIQNHKEP